MRTTDGERPGLHARLRTVTVELDALVLDELVAMGRAGAGGDERLSVVVPANVRPAEVVDLQGGERVSAAEQRRAAEQRTITNTMCGRGAGASLSARPVAVVASGNEQAAASSASNTPPRGPRIDRCLAPRSAPPSAAAPLLHSTSPLQPPPLAAAERRRSGGALLLLTTLVCVVRRSRATRPSSRGSAAHRAWLTADA